MQNETDWLAFLIDLPKNSLSGALILLMAAAILSLLGRFVRGVYEFFAKLRDKRRHVKEVVIDILIHADFDSHSVRKITNPDRIANIKAQIGENPTGYRPFIAYEPDDPTFEDYRAIRRGLDTALMVACDRFFDNSHLFHRYYEKLSSDDFLALSEARKYGALDSLCTIGNTVLVSYDRLLKEMENSDVSKELSQKVGDLIKQARAREIPVPLPVAEDVKR